MRTPKKSQSLLAAAVLALALSTNARADQVSWSITNPPPLDPSFCTGYLFSCGIPASSATQNSPGDWTLNYYSKGFQVYFGQQWIVSATAVDGGTYTFDWDYSGFHSWSLAHAFLFASDFNYLVPFTGTSGSFDFSGSYTFNNVSAGQTIGFYIYGDNFDAFDLLEGNLNLVQVTSVPEPETYAILLAGLGLLGFAARRRMLKEAAAA